MRRTSGWTYSVHVENSGNVGRRRGASLDTLKSLDLGSENPVKRERNPHLYVCFSVVRFPRGSILAYMLPPSAYVFLLAGWRELKNIFKSLRSAASRTRLEVPCICSANDVQVFSLLAGFRFVFARMLLYGVSFCCVRMPRVTTTFKCVELQNLRTKGTINGFVAEANPTEQFP